MRSACTFLVRTTDRDPFHGYATFCCRVNYMAIEKPGQSFWDPKRKPYFESTSWWWIRLQIDVRRNAMLKTILSITVLGALSCGIVFAGGVTNVKEIINNTAMTIEVKKYDVKTGSAGADFETTGEIPANGGTWSGDMWVPWVDNTNDFVEKHMEVRVYRGTAFSIWQSGEYVRYNDRVRFVSNARRVSGEARSGGERRLVVSQNKEGRVVFEFQRL